MATEVQINDQGSTAKVRNPLAVPGLAIITLGIYYLVWYYKVNREMADWGKQNNVDIGDSPGTSLLAITLGALIIVPALMSIWGTGQRMERAQKAGGVDGGSGIIYFIMHFIPFVWIFTGSYLQSCLNNVWEAREAPAVSPDAVPVAQA
jgi:hypothetical protein